MSAPCGLLRRGRSGQLRPFRTATVAGALAGLLLAGCVDAESVFTDGRIEDRCTSAIPVCNSYAGCVLEQDEYFSGAFPGGQRFVVRTTEADTKLIVGILLVEPRSDGSEISAQVYAIGCSDVDEQRTVDRSLFDFAGDDGIIEYEFTVAEQGDHLVQIFSDMNSDFLFRVERE